MEANKYEDVLNEVNIITKKYFEKAKISGERFNIFQILGMEYNENRTHSAFLHSMLNPRGQHLQGTLFLELFLAEIKWIDNFNLETATVDVEKHIGYKDKNNENGGRIDLVIKDKLGNAILIENKIYAIDQPNQLKRYYNYGLLHHSLGNKKFKLVYLTLDGNHPSNNTTGDLTADIIQEKIINLSYKAAKPPNPSPSIINWLTKCKSAVEPNSLKEAIEQYINLLKIITNNTNQFNMTEEIQKLFTNNLDNFNAAVEISNSILKFKQEIRSQFNIELEIKANKILNKEILHNGNRIKFKLVIDTPEYYFSFWIVDSLDKDIAIREPNLNLIRDFFITHYPDFLITEWIIKINPCLIGYFERLSQEQIFLLNKKEKRNEWIEDIVKEGDKYFKDLENYLKTTPELLHDAQTNISNTI